MKIVGLSGKKQAGKNTVCNFLWGQYLVHTGQVENYHIDAQTGELCLDKEIDTPYLIYSFADYLKELCVLFGLSPEMVYGTDEQKNQFTHIRWDNMPMYTIKDVPIPKKIYGGGNEFMTAREFMQVLGTDVCRRIYEPIWVESLMKRIAADQVEVAFICDVRYPNEIKAIEQNGGKVIRLTRAPFVDSHSGETCLDDYQFDLVVDNKDMDIPTQNYETFKLIKEYLF